MSRPAYSPYSTPGRPATGWPLNAVNTTQKSRHFTSTTAAAKHENNTPRMNRNSTRSTAQKDLRPSTTPTPMTMTTAPPAVYQFWSPPPRSTSPKDESWARALQPDLTNSASSSSSSDEDDSPAENSVPFVAQSKSKPKSSKPTSNPIVKLDQDHKIWTPQNSTDTLVESKPISKFTSAMSMSGQQGGMQLLAYGADYRSPSSTSVRYDKVIHGARSPATTIHLALPHAAGARAANKPRLPLPAPGKQQQPPAARAPALSRPHTTESVQSPPVIGLDLALMPPTDHRDSAMLLRTTSAFLQTPARPHPSLDVPKRMSTSTSNNSNNSHASRTTTSSRLKHVSAPAPSPISPIAPEPFPKDNIRRASLAPSSAPAPASIPKTATRPSNTNDVSPPVPPKDIPRLSVSQPIKHVESAPTILTGHVYAPINERAEIGLRTLSSTNLAAQARRSEFAASSHFGDPVPQPTVQHIVNAERNLSRVVDHPIPTQPAHRPAPVPLQPEMVSPTDDMELEDEVRPPLRVVNITSESEIRSDTLMSEPLAKPVQFLEPIVDELQESPKADLPPIVIVSPEGLEHSIPPPVATAQPAEDWRPRSTISSKHSSMHAQQIPSRPPSNIAFPVQQDPVVSLPRISLHDNAVRYESPSPAQPSQSQQPPLRIPPSYRSRPRNLTVPTPLSPPIRQAPAGPTYAPAPPAPQPVQTAQPIQPAHRVQVSHSRPEPEAAPQPIPRFRHAHTKSDPMRANRPPSTFPRLEEYDLALTSDEEDPTVWAPYPDASSRRSSRSSRSSRSFNSHQRASRASIYANTMETDEEDGGYVYAPPSISLPNLRPILQYRGAYDEPITPHEGRKIKFLVPENQVDKPATAAGGSRNRLRKRSNSTDSVLRAPKNPAPSKNTIPAKNTTSAKKTAPVDPAPRGPRQVPWSDGPKRSSPSAIDTADPFGFRWHDEGKYDILNHPELIPRDVFERYVRPDGAPKLPEYRENFSAKANAQRAAAEEEQRARILGRRQRQTAVSIKPEEEEPITVPVCLRRPRATSESTGSKLRRRRSRSRDRHDNWAPPPTIPDPEPPAYPQISMPPSNSFSKRVGRKLSMFSRK